MAKNFINSDVQFIIDHVDIKIEALTKIVYERIDSVQKNQNAEFRLLNQTIETLRDKVLGQNGHLSTLDKGKETNKKLIEELSQEYHIKHEDLNNRFISWKLIKKNIWFIITILLFLFLFTQWIYNDMPLELREFIKWVKDLIS